MKKYLFLFLAVALTAGAAELPMKVSVLDSSVLYIRASQVPDDVVDQVRAASAPGHLEGTVLDLRFADGAATNAADYFIHRKLPLVVLVNGETRGAAAELATELRASASAVLIGSTNSESLSPDIAVAVSAAEEKEFQEDPFFKIAAAPAGNLSDTNDLLAFVDHTSEADLVRKRIKDGEDDGEVSKPRAEPPQPVIRDPELARAMDLLKALAVLHAARG